MPQGISHKSVCVLLLLLLLLLLQGGFVASLVWMTPCAAIALGSLNYYQQKLSREENPDTLPLVAPGSAAAVSAADKANGTATTAPADIAAPARYGSGAHVEPGNDNVVHPEPAAAADDSPAPAHLTNLGHVAAEPEGVVPVADANGLPSTRTF
jgi:hypothetical protein